MKTLQVDISNATNPSDVLSKLRNKDINEGDTLKIKSKWEEPFVALVILVVILVVLHLKKDKNTTKSNDNKTDFGQDIINKLFDKNLSAEQIEQQIKDEYGVSIEKEVESDETSYLLSNEANKDHLMQSIKEKEDGKLISFTPEAFQAFSKKTKKRAKKTA